MRNDFIGTSIDGDARAACGCHHHNTNTINTAGCGCENNRRSGCGCNRQTRNTENTCGCENNRQTRNTENSCGCESNRQTRNTENTCGCENSHQARNTENSCGCENSRQARNTENSCGCENSRQTRSNNHHDCDNGCSHCGRTPAMVYAEQHDLDNMYCAEKALLRGTLFGCLDKPMCNEQCTENACTTDCQEDKFSIWELRLYLNTHPCDKQALAMMRKLTREMDEDCTCAVTSDCSRWSWIEGPWPWEYQRCCGKEA